MEQNLLLTIILAAIVMGVVIAGLSIGLLLTGKSRLRRGCGLAPGKKKKDKSTSCSICGDKPTCEETEEKDVPHTDKHQSD